ncbi:MAG: aspartate carbamoyltransferase [Gammaproteobacteria bacterium]|nr:aspartate carbamoyltransferase [Gammaproteobacteria bacterium]|tara:strand:+ start:3453 stop:4466 length:1014 start_codon:yes stop_codon:yes gene_type:complete
MDFSGSHILSIDQFDRSDIEKLFSVADKLEPYATKEKITRVLEGAILGNMFFEPSTRTRISFGASFNLLGGNVREITEVESSSLAKGESLADTAQVLSGYSDIIVMRHPEVNSVKKFAEASRVPVINAGDGSNEHPSQALLDLYTIQKELSQNNKSIDGLRIALVGDLKFGRAVHSLCKILSLYDDVKMNLISPEELKLPIELVESISAKGVTITETENLEDGISEVDIIYVTRVQEERFKNKQDADKYRGLLSLNQSIYTANCEPNTVIMHPLPRDSRSDANELDSDLYENPNLAIFRQADNGIVIRMAIFTLVLDIEEKIDQSSMPVNWKVGLKN